MKRLSLSKMRTLRNLVLLYFCFVTSTLFLSFIYLQSIISGFLGQADRETNKTKIPDAGHQIALKVLYWDSNKTELRVMCVESATRQSYTGGQECRVVTLNHIYTVVPNHATVHFQTLFTKYSPKFLSHRLISFWKGFTFHQGAS